MHPLAPFPKLDNLYRSIAEANPWLGQKMPRRQAINLIGLTALSFGIPFSCTNQKQQLSSIDLQASPYKTLAEVGELIRTKKISSEALTQLMLERIAAHDKRLHSYITVTGEDALKDAKALDKELAQNKYRGPLHGVPVGVKDILYTTNAPTTGGHAFKANFVPSYNATVVDRLRNAGAVILGQTQPYRRCYRWLQFHHTNPQKSMGRRPVDRLIIERLWCCNCCRVVFWINRHGHGRFHGFLHLPTALWALSLHTDW